jgi:pyruvate,orthophosphate dikinase
VEFCHEIGLNDVSCSPFRIPIARLAAAQAALKERQLEELIKSRSKGMKKKAKKRIGPKKKAGKRSRKRR